MDALTGIGIAIGLLVLLVLVGNCFVYRKLASAKTTSFKFSLAPLLILSVAPLLIITFPVFAIYRQVVSLILAWRYKSKYWGLLEGRDAVYNLENENPAHFLFIVKYPSNRPQCFYDAVRNAMHEALVLNSNANPKIFGAVRTFLGYSYLLKNEITFDDCFQKLKSTAVPMSKEDLLQVLSESTTTPLPKNREGLWDVLVGTQAVKWTDDTENNEEQYYPILFRLNHTFADAPTALQGIIGLFADSSCAAHVQQTKEPEPTDQRSLSVRSVLNFCVNMGKSLMFCMRQFYIALLAPSVGLVNSLLMVDDSNILHGPKLTYKKHFLLNVEKSPRYVQITKKIKKKVPGSTFEDVCLAALAASFKEYFQKNSGSVPEYIVAEVPAIPPALIKPEKPKAGEIFCRNRLTFAIRRLPIKFDLENSTTPITKMLEITKKEGNVIRHSLEHEVNYFVLRVACHLVPGPILRPFFDIVHNCTALISNVPGPKVITVMGGCRVQDIIPWAANRGYTGLGITVLTYDERLQISLVLDKSVSSTGKGARGLIEGFYKHLDLLEQETMNIADETTS